MAKLNITSSPSKGGERYLNLDIHRKNKKLKKLVFILSIILTTSIVVNLYTISEIL